uniref:Sensor histidine kinase n=1 Tax=Desertifilum tharense IPPAS B-1220 TaxID=1781255 RepID=A0ACD5GQM2_9CYAN
MIKENLNGFQGNAEAALRETERRFRAIFDRTVQFMGLLNFDGTVLELNLMAQRLLQQSIGELVYHPLWMAEVWRGTPQQSKLQQAIALAAQGELIHYEAEIEIAGRETIILELSLQPVKDESDRIVSIVVQGHDITNRKQVEVELRQAREILQQNNQALEMMVEERTAALMEANWQLQAEIREREEIEAQLRHSEQRYRTLVQNFPNGAVCLFDADLRFSVADGLELPPFACKRWEGKTIYELFSAELCSSLEAHLQAALQGQNSICEVPLAEQFYWLYTLPVRDRQGQVIAGMLMTQNMTSRRQMEDKLKQSLKEKEVLLKEIHHRVKNNLQVISSLLKLQSGYIKDENTIALFKDSYNRVRSMTLIHEKLYRSQDLGRIDVPDYIHTLTGNLIKSYVMLANTIQLELNIEKVLLDVDTAIPCGLMINELVSNCLKYAFPKGDSGKIQVDFGSVDEQYFQLSVRDNGIGLPKDFDFETADSLGLQLVVNLTEQLEGTLQIDCESGTCITIRFPSRLKL